MKKLVFIISSFVTILFTGCSKEFLDVNENPNASSEAAIDNVLPSTQVYTSYILGNHFYIIGSLWSQYTTQNPTSNQYNNYDSYSFISSDMERVWRDTYAGSLKDLDFIEKTATKEGKSNYVAIAKILKAYNYQLLTDAYGDIPFSQALQAESGVSYPAFDTQESVYNGIITLLDEAIANIIVDPTDPNYKPVTARFDFIYAGNMTKWMKFANTLKLRVYLRQASIRPAVAQAGIQKMYADGVSFIGNGDAAELAYYTTQFNRNPIEATTPALSRNLILSKTTLDYFTNTTDSRIDVFYVKPTTGPFGPKAGPPAVPAKHNGIPQGDKLVNPYPGSSVSDFSIPIGMAGGGNATTARTAPVVFMSIHESLFLQAEASARGWGTGNAKTLYDAAVTASFTKVGKAADAPIHLAKPAITFPVAGSLEDKIKLIITQKWAAMCGTQNFEAWTEWRRTGYPDFFQVSLGSQLPAGVFPARLLYPQNDSGTNNPNAPAQQRVQDHVWWDIN